MNYTSSNCGYIKRPWRGKCVHLINIRETNSAKIGFTFLFYVSCNVCFVTCLQKKNSNKYEQTLYLLSGQVSSTLLAEIVLLITGSLDSSPASQPIHITALSYRIMLRAKKMAVLQLLTMLRLVTKGKALSHSPWELEGLSVRGLDQMSVCLFVCCLTLSRSLLLIHRGK